MTEQKIGFELRRIRLNLDCILPVKTIPKPQAREKGYARILASIRDVGLIEPLIVHRPSKSSTTFVLLDGHLRLHALKELGQTEAECLISTQDECYTYNARVNRIAPIQEHTMIKRAVQNGVSPDRIASALNVKLAEVNATLKLMDGIHEAAADMLKSTDIRPRALGVFRKVSGVRQVEMAQLMLSANNFTYAYAEALYIGTPKCELVEPGKPKTKRGLAPEIVAKMEHEMEAIEGDFKKLEATYGENMLCLTIVRGYLTKLLQNEKVVRFMNGSYEEFFSEFKVITAIETIGKAE